MSKQTINIGASPNDGTGTPLRTSFDYTNQNFTEIYTALGGGVALPGATTQVIFNDGGTNLAGDAGLVYNKTTDALTVAGLVTAGSATITGDLTVDTNVLKVDSTLNRVGVLNTPTVPFEVTGLIAASSGAFQAGASNGIFAALNNDGTNPGLDLRRWTGSANNHGTAYIATSSAGDALFYTDAQTSNTKATSLRMTLNSTGLGVGGSPNTGFLTVGSTSNVSATANALTILSQRATFVVTANGATDAAGTTINYAWANGGQGPLIFRNAAIANVMTLDASGNLLVGLTSGSFNRIKKDSAADAGNAIFELVGASNATSSIHYSVSSYNANAANAASKFGRDATTLRSINAGGTVNAIGADYAEYMVKCSDFILSKGDVAGIDANGKLTNVFADAISFVVKSTDPSYVGNDKWGVDLKGDALETARQLVDRIAFAGQVPVNVTGAKSGDYIVPVVNGTGIKGISVSKPTFEQYQLAVGKVIAIDTDGRARIIVKVA